MKMKKSVKGPFPGFATGVATGATCLIFGPIGILAGPLFYLLFKKAAEEEIDKVALDNSQEIYREWERNKQGGETTLKVSVTKRSGIFPITGEYTFKCKK